MSAVNHPTHYNQRVPGIECIDVVRWFNFNLGNVIKYVWRAGDKGETIQDLEKAVWYLQNEIERLRLLQHQEVERELSSAKELLCDVRELREAEEKLKYDY